MASGSSVIAIIFCSFAVSSIVSLVLLLSGEGVMVFSIVGVAASSTTCSGTFDKVLLFCDLCGGSTGLSVSFSLGLGKSRSLSTASDASSVLCCAFCSGSCSSCCGIGVIWGSFASSCTIKTCQSASYNFTL